MRFSNTLLFILQVNFQVFKNNKHKSALIFHCFAAGMLSVFLPKQIWQIQWSVPMSFKVTFWGISLSDLTG